jgi:hypothetical protein
MSGNVICVGGGENSASSYSTSALAYVAGFGYTWNSADPLASVYPLIMSQYRPTGQAAGGAWDALCEACMRTRTMLFCNKVPNDCGSGDVNPLTSVNTAKQLSGLGISGASTGIGIANAFGAGISSVAGSIIPGIGIALSAILQIFQNHAAAEAKQANVLCSLNPYASSAIQQIDAAILAGVDSPNAGYSAMVQLGVQYTGGLAAIYKKGNAADGYERIMACQIAASLYRYGLSTLPPSLNPMASASVATVTEAQIADTNVILSTSEDESSATYETTAGQVATSAPTVSAALPIPATANNSTLLLVVIAAAIIWGIFA